MGFYVIVAKSDLEKAGYPLVEMPRFGEDEKAYYEAALREALDNDDMMLVSIYEGYLRDIEDGVKDEFIQILDKEGGKPYYVQAWECGKARYSIRANRWGRTYHPLTEALRAIGATWEEC